MVTTGRAHCIHLCYIYITQMNLNNTNELKPVKERNILSQCENPKNCPERDLNPRPRLSSADVLTTTPSGRSRNNAAELKTLKFVWEARAVSHKALSSAALSRDRPDGVVVNTSTLESRGRGFKSRSGPRKAVK